MSNIIPIVINWHLTEACNYSCHYCYAKWNKTANPRELIHDSGKALALLEDLYQFFRPGNSANPLSGELTWNSVRLNLAGGEPFLYSGKLLAIVNQARSLGFDVSLISNGSFLNDELLDHLAPQLTWLGISIDSASPLTNKAIGRIDRHGRMLDLVNLAQSLQRARQSNSGMRLKLNTVVNQLNHSEDLSELITNFAPDKWKVLRMLPVVSRDLITDDQQYAAFLARHRTFSRILCAEDNQDMQESYLMIDPHGRFFQNSQLIAGRGYDYSQPILEVGAEAAFSEMSFNSKQFSARYISENEVGE